VDAVETISGESIAIDDAMLKFLAGQNVKLAATILGNTHIAKNP